VQKRAGFDGSLSYICSILGRLDEDNRIERWQGYGRIQVHEFRCDNGSKRRPKNWLRRVFVDNRVLLCGTLYRCVASRIRRRVGRSFSLIHVVHYQYRGSLAGLGVMAVEPESTCLCGQQVSIYTSSVVDSNTRSCGICRRCVLVDPATGAET
jgi:hypothetical protein